MKPLFFPHTYVTEPTINACRYIFSGISVFQSSMKHIPKPIGTMGTPGFFGCTGPDPKVSRIFDKILAETENWARSHRGGVVSFLKGYQEGVPFFEPSSVSQIRQDIRTAGQTVSPDASQQDALLRARIFLQIAQDFDAHNQWLSHQMLQQEAMERSLYRELRGDERSMDRVTGPGQPWENEDTFQYMILDRLKAWSRVMLSHGHVGPLVTTAASVLTLIQEHVPDTEKFILAATIPAIHKDAAIAKEERRDLIGYCEKLVYTPMPLLNDSGLLDTYPVEITDNFSMKLYLLPGIAPQSLFRRFVEGELPGDGDAADETNTLIGYINKDISANCQ
ncbi:MAG TPA: hypothetical protein ENL37_04070 [Desulfobacteraceae bacterium]|nr:hypothetical protein [Desulfobacteraceae bacterium]